MNKKGFTLVELLAVIVILALLALLTSTAVTKLVKEAKNDLSKTQIQLIKSAADTWIADNLNNLPSNGSCGYLTLEDLKNYGLLDNIILDPKNSEEISNDLKIKITTTTSPYGKLVASSEVNPDSIEECTQIYFPVCTLANDSEVQGLNMGAKYNCKVDPNKEAYTFYVLTTPESGATSVNLIMDSNITSTGEAIKDTNPTDKGNLAWINNAHFLESGGNQTDWDNYENSNIYGPITAIEYLQAATSSWTNVNSQTISTFADDSGATHAMAKEYTANARMPYISEVGATGCSTSMGSCPLWMVDYLDNGYPNYEGRTGVSGVYGYWTLSSSGSSTSTSWSVQSSSNAWEYPVESTYDNGVRPVIVVPLNRITQ